MSATPPSGMQFEISAGPYRAVAVENGGGLRDLRHGDRPLLEGYDVTALADGGRGQVLAPWPNRLRDGRWSWDGAQRQLPVTEPAKGTANHGLVRWATWSVLTEESHRVSLVHRLQPQPGYPFRLELTADYALDAGTGLHVTVTAKNISEEPAPVALGMHPYLAAAPGLVDECTLTVPAGRRLVTDQQGIPVGAEPVEGTPYDFRAPRRIGGLPLDTCYTDLRPDQDGLVRVVLRAPDGTATAWWADGSHRWLQVFSGDTLAPQRRRRGLAVEPMTAPADALATGEGLAVLEPGDLCTLSWGLSGG